METAAAPSLAQPLLSTRLFTHPQQQRVWRGTFLGRPTIFKQRFSKSYRHPTLNARLTAARVRAEARALGRARRLGVPAPALLFVDSAASTLYLEDVAGPTLRDVLRAESSNPGRVERLMAGVGACVAALHDGGLVHGDLTTSNLLIRPKADKKGDEEEEEEVVVIDFGLAVNSGTAEDKAVDLFVLERALTAAHATTAGGGGDGGGGGAADGEGSNNPPPKHGPAAHCPDALFASVLASYRHHSRHWRGTLAKFAEVRLRGRKRSMVG
jgi:TP53 regulating kinase and related kinases